MENTKQYPNQQYHYHPVTRYLAIFAALFCLVMALIGIYDVLNQLPTLTGSSITLFKSALVIYLGRFFWQVFNKKAVIS